MRRPWGRSALYLGLASWSMTYRYENTCAEQCIFPGCYGERLLHGAGKGTWLVNINKWKNVRCASREMVSHLRLIF